MGKYAEGTRVPVAKSREEIERILQRFGADAFGFMSEPDKSMVAFRCRERNIRFDLPLPQRAAARNVERWEREVRERWRALALCIKAKLSAVESGIETFEEAFLAHVVMPDGRTVGEHAVPALERHYKDGTSGALLPPPSRPAKPRSE